MPKCLTPVQIEQYREEGCVFPMRIMSETEAAELRGQLEAFERRTGGPLQGDMRHKSHLLFAWLAELVRCHASSTRSRISTARICWTTSFFVKEAADPAFVSWHQDSPCWGLSTPDVVAAWVAFTRATEANGAMEYIPGSHKLDQIPHRDTFAKHNVLTRGQEVMVEVDRSQRRIITLVPARCHCTTCASSTPRRPTRRTIGASALPSAISRRWWRKLAGEDSATLVRGEDHHYHFISEPQPTRDLDPEFVALHRTITERNARILYRGTDVANSTSRRRWRNASKPSPRAA